MVHDVEVERMDGDQLYVNGGTKDAKVEEIRLNIEKYKNTTSGPRSGSFRTDV